MLSIYAIDPAGISRGALTPLSAKAVVRESGLGTWTVALDMSEPLASRLAPGWSLVFQDETLRLSGRITSFKSVVEGSTRTLELAGVDEMHRLAGRLVYPNPAKPTGSQDRARYDAKGNAETVLKDLVSLNAGPLALPDRRSPAFEVEASVGRGSQVTISERLSTLLEVAQSIASQGGLVFSAVREDTGKVVFRTRAPRDLSRQYRFEATGDFSQEAPKANTVVMAGQGEGADRTLFEKVSSEPSWGHRVEVLKDRRDSGDTAILVASADEALEESGAKNGASLKVSESEDVLFGKHFSLGDTITVQLAGVSISEPIRTAEITWTPYGRDVELGVGSEDKAPRWSPRIKELDSRLRALESR